MNKIKDIDKYLDTRYGISYTDLNIALINKNNKILELQNAIIELSDRIYKVRKYLLGYESYIPEDDIPEIINMLDGE